MRLSNLSLALTAVYGPTALTISQLLPSGAGRVAAIYSDPAKPSYDECIQKNMAARGPELAVNPTLPAGVTQDGDWFVFTDVSAASYVLFQVGTVPDPNKTWIVTFEVEGFVAGGVRAIIYGPTPGQTNAYVSPTVTANGKSTVVVNALATMGTAASSRVAIQTQVGTTTLRARLSVREIDLSKCVLFSDAAGQTPVVYPIGAGQGKGLLLDRSAGLVRGPELWVAPTLGTTWTDNGDGSYTTNNPTGAYDELRITAPRSAFYEVAFDYVVTGQRLTFRTDGLTAFSAPIGSGRSRGIAYASGVGSALLSFARSTAAVAQTATISNISVRELPGHHQQQPTAEARGEFSRRYNQLLATATLSTQSITAIATQYRLYFTGAGTVTLSGAATGTYSAGSHTITCTAGSLTLTVAGEVLTADLRFEADATIGLPEYQRVTTASDYDEVGFPTYWRAQTDDWAKSHMNPNGATKAYVFWAGQKMSDDQQAVLVETSTGIVTNLGAFVLRVPLTVDLTALACYSKGTNLSGAASNNSLPAPIRITAVVHGDITSDVCSLTANGTTTTNTADQGTGTYLEHDIFFGARAGTSLFANFREYAPPTILFLQPADSLSASHLAKLQRGYAKAVGVTL